VTIELGEPLHAFDIRHVEDGTIVIRRAKGGEKLTILGGKVLTLTTDDLVIASKSKALSLAGMIGGAESGVQPDTTEIVLEAATYNQASIRRSSIRHSVRTEASTRHEKFLHPHLAEIALQRAASLIVEICGGEIVALADSYPDPVKESTLDLRLSEVERLGGVKISPKDAENYLSSLGFIIVRVSDFPPKADQPLAEEFRVSVPYWRTDIEQEADLVEEILRLYGYEHIPASLPPSPSPKNITSYWFKLEERIRDVMLQLGFDEQITEPLTKSNSKFKILNSNNGKQIRLQNALNAKKKGKFRKIRSPQTKIVVGLIHLTPRRLRRKNL
jgi:phenylalanyl-tRNA synthetase beta chain